jgi:hypothetical protein
MSITWPGYRPSRHVTFLAQQKKRQNALAAAGGVTVRPVMAAKLPLMKILNPVLQGKLILYM